MVFNRLRKLLHFREIHNFRRKILKYHILRVKITPSRSPLVDVFLFLSISKTFGNMKNPCTKSRATLAFPSRECWMTRANTKTITSQLFAQNLKTAPRINTDWPRPVNQPHVHPLFPLSSLLHHV